jgi:hypothetical protein
MSSTASKADFLLIFRNTQLEKRLSIDQMDEAMRQFSGWLDRWKQAGAIKAGQPLGNEGRTISGARSRVVADGPYPEAKEAIGGYVLVQAENMDEAVKIAAEWPLLAWDAFIEIRPLVDQCAAMHMLSKRAEAAGELNHSAASIG